VIFAGRSSLKRLCTQLCIGLALIFSGASAANAVDHIQHMPGASADHVHLSFSLATADPAVEHDDHAGPDHGASQAPETGGAPYPEQPSGHHHADSGSGLPAFAAAHAAPPQPVPARLAQQPEKFVLGLNVRGPERPPKH
jgi:hypothetical protein